VGKITALEAPNFKHQYPNNEQISNDRNSSKKPKFLGDWSLVIGYYLEPACLPVGREFGDWNLKIRNNRGTFS